MSVVVLVLVAVCAVAGCTTVAAGPRPGPVPARPAGAVPPVRDAPDGSAPVQPPVHVVLGTVGPRTVGRPAPVTAQPGRHDRDTRRRPRTRHRHGRTGVRHALPGLPRMPALPVLPLVRGLPRPAELCALGSRYAGGPAYGGKAAVGVAGAVARVCARATAHR